MTTYNAQYFIDKFEAIPEEEWCCKVYSIKNSHCALGHCGVKAGHEKIDFSEEAKALTNLFIKNTYRVWAINDLHDPQYQQQTPKQRILAALRDIQKMGG